MRLPAQFFAVVLRPQWNRCGQATCKRSAHKSKTKRDLRNEQISSCHLRREALMLKDKRDRYFSMASDAYKRGQGKLAKVFAERGHQTNSIMKKLNEQAVSERLLTENMFSERNTLNVHGLYVQEAISVITEFLDSYLHQHGQVTIITGRGQNSPAHSPKLLPAVKSYLTQEGYAYREPRAGVIELSLWESW